MKHEIQNTKEYFKRLMWRLKWDSQLTTHLIIGGFYASIIVGMLLWKV